MIKVKSAEYIGSYVKRSQLPMKGYPEFAFIGRSNVGKSSLINGMLNRKKLAKTSSTPGKTQTLNYFLINDKFYFVDLPGYGFAKAPEREREKWRIFIEDYLQNRRQLCGVLTLFDFRHPPTSLDVVTYEWLKFILTEKKMLYVATKQDKVPRGKQQQNLNIAIQRFGFIDKQMIIPFSSKTFEGKKDIWKWVEEAMKTFF